MIYAHPSRFVGVAAAHSHFDPILCGCPCTQPSAFAEKKGRQYMALALMAALGFDTAVIGSS